MADWEFIDDEPEVSSDWEWEEPMRAKARPAKPKKPVKVQKLAPRQEFYKPLPPQVPSKFHFETAPFTETPEKYVSRIAKRPPATMRASTPKEAMESEMVRQEQRLYDLLGPTGYSVVRGLRGAGRGLAAPLISMGEALEETPKLLKSTLKGEILKSEPEFDPSEHIIRQDIEPPTTKVLPTLIEQGAPLLLGKFGGRFGRMGESLPFSPELGGAAPKVPSQLSPGRVMEGRPVPPPPLRPPAPLELRRGRTIAGFPPIKPPVKPSYLPPSPGELARLDPGRLRPLGDMGLMSEGAIGQAVSDDLSFDLLPALRPGQSPVMIVPQWVINAVANIHTGLTEGATAKFDLIPGALARIEHFAPSPEHAERAKEAIREIQKAVADEGLTSIPLVSQDIIKGRKIFEESREEFERLGVVPAEVTSHETLHVGQYKVAEKYLGAPDIYRLHDRAWAANHPVIQERMAKNPSLVPEQEAIELPAYVMGRQTLRKFKTTAEGIDFLFESLQHLQEKYGEGALDILETTARVSPGLEDAISLARSMHESQRLERSVERGVGGPGVGELPGVGRSLSQVEAGGVEPRTGEAGVRALSGEAPGISPADRGANLEQYESLPPTARRYVDEAIYARDKIQELLDNEYDPNSSMVRVFQQRLDYAEGEMEKIRRGELTEEEKLYKTYVEPTEDELAIRDQEALDALALSEAPGIGLKPYEGEARRLAADNGLDWEQLSRYEQRDYIEEAQRIWNRGDLEAETRPEPISEEELARREIESLYPIHPEMSLSTMDPDDLGFQAGFKGLAGVMGESFRQAMRDSVEKTGKLPSIEKGSSLDKAFESAVAGGAPRDVTTLDAIMQSVGQGTPLALSDRFPIGSKVTYNQPGTIGRSGSGEVIGYKKDPTTGETFLEVKDPSGLVETVGDIDDIRMAGEVVPSPTISVGDKVAFRESPGMGEAEVTEIFGDIVTTRWAGGQLRKVPIDKLAKATPPERITQATPKVQESNEKLKALHEISIVRDITDPRQSSLPGIQAPRKLIAEPPLPHPINPPIPGIGPEYPPLKKERITHEYVEMTTQAFKDLLKAEGIKEDPTLAPFLQVRRALLEGRIQPKGFENILAEHGMNMEQYTEELAETASEAGRVLQEYSELSIEDIQIVRLMKENLEVAEAIIPAKRRMEAILRDIEAGQLGRNFLQRASRRAVQLILSDLSIMFKNSITTAGRIPIMAGTQSIGAWIKHVHMGKAQGETLEQAMEGAMEDARIGLEASAEMIAALTPRQLRKFIGLAGRGNRERYREVITQLEKHFPTLHKELVTPGFAPESLEEGKQSLDLAEATLKKMRVDVKNRDDMVKRFRVAEERFKLNSSKMGKALTKAGYPLDALMAPMNLSEMFFRRPMFYGYLNMRLKLGDARIPESIKGMDLSEIVQQNKFDQIPEDLLKDSIDEALYITHAYMPRAERGAAELNARRIILALNSAKIVSPATAIWFPRALYNGLKFAWEIVPLIPLIGGPPLGMIRPTIKMFNQKYVEDPKTGKKVPVDPMTSRDYTKMASGIIGMVLYGLAEWIRGSEYGGPEWYQINTGKKGKNGEPVYQDVKGYMPLSLFLLMADLNRRMRKRLIGDIDYAQEMGKALLGAQNTPGVGEWINALMDLFGGEEGATIKKAKVEVGRQLVAPFTKPLVNIRNAWASFDEEENRRKDLKGTGILGPAIDNIPWLRRQPLGEWTWGILPTLPNMESMTQEGPIRLSEDPLTAMAGIKLTEGENFAGREWRRLGLYNKTFLQPDPDPVINRAQNQMFRLLVSGLGAGLEEDPSYAQKDDVGKAAIWERYLGKISSRAIKYGPTANPEEASRRRKKKKLEEAGMGPLQQKDYGIDEMLKKMAPEK